MRYRRVRPEAVRAAWLAGVVHAPLLPDDDRWLSVLRSSGRLAG